MTSRGRGRCPSCGREFSLSKAGRLRLHSIKGERRIACRGSGQLPAVEPVDAPEPDE